jgi:peptidoglycan hydrolase-like protein with peptidoglycan-binding domain
MKRRLFCVLLAGSSLTLFADEPVRSMQEELRRRNIYFGDVDGRKTPEFDEAVKRYQKRKGLPTNGAEDRETLRSLKLLGREPGEAPPRELAWPDEPVLKSDAKIDVAQEAVRIAEETGVEPSSVAPTLTAVSTKDQAATGHRGAIASRRSSRTGAARGRSPTDGARALVTAGSSVAQQITPKELFMFVRDYLRAINRRDLQDELRFYADSVEYFHNGEVDRRIVERTLRDYYQRWPKRTVALDTPVEYRPDPSRGEIVISFQVNFTLKGNRGLVKGRTENQIVINAATADPRIVKIQERRLRS